MSEKKGDGETLSLQKAVALFAARENCSGQSCDRCPLKTEWRGCGDSQHDYWEAFCGILGIENSRVLKGGVGGGDPAVTAYETVMNLDASIFEVARKAPDEEQRESDLERTCVTCLHSAMHPSGIRWCKSFGNFVHEDGFCYRWQSDKIEQEEPVDK